MKFKHQQIQYIEFLSADLPRVKQFYSAAFDWQFTDYGPDYSSFSGDYVDGGFDFGTPQRGSILVILYSENLEQSRQRVIAAGGVILKDIFSFPGGRRFQFSDPDGNELAVWSDQ
jgi:uncharacterized protein